MHNSKYQCHMAAWCTYHKPTPKQEPYKKAYLFTKNIEEFSGKSSGEWTSRQGKKKDRKSNRTRQKDKSGDSKVESNDSPERFQTGRRRQTSPASLRDVPTTPSG